jgi:hypothetical protein
MAIEDKLSEIHTREHIRKDNSSVSLYAVIHPEHADSLFTENILDIESGKAFYSSSAKGFEVIETEKRKNSISRINHLGTIAYNLQVNESESGYFAKIDIDVLYDPEKTFRVWSLRDRIRKSKEIFKEDKSSKLIEKVSNFFNLGYVERELEKDELKRRSELSQEKNEPILFYSGGRIKSIEASGTSLEELQSNLACELKQQMNLEVSNNYLSSVIQKIKGKLNYSVNK